jgi:hypothetical protein
MTSLIDLFFAHQVLGTMIGGAVWNAFVGSLAAPTKDSSAYYVFLFKFCNTLAFNFARAKSTSIENSPNFQDAVNRYLAQQPSTNPAANPNAGPTLQS